MKYLILILLLCPVIAFAQDKRKPTAAHKNMVKVQKRIDTIRNGIIYRQRWEENAIIYDTIYPPRRCEALVEFFPTMQKFDIYLCQNFDTTSLLKMINAAKKYTTKDSNLTITLHLYK